MKIKVCGITNPGNMAAIAVLPIDYLGWIFYDDSPRDVMPTIEQLATVDRQGKSAVGVFVNRPVDQILKAIDLWGLDAVQLHGTESNDDCRRLAAHTTVIKAIHVATSADMVQCQDFPDAEYLLLESRNAKWGGSGKQFDWNLLEHYHAPQLFFLSGGLGPGDAKTLAHLDHPKLAGIDVNSKFESSPGIKDVSTLSQFVSTLKFQVHATRK